MDLFDFGVRDAQTEIARSRSNQAEKAETLAAQWLRDAQVAGELPEPAAARLRASVAFALGQIYVLGRLWAKLAFWASETALFQDRLAHAGYVARPEPRWPESPAAAAIQP